MKNKSIKLFASTFAASALIVAAGATTAFAQGFQGGAPRGDHFGGMMGGRGGMMMGRVPGIFGTVSSISGTTIVVQSKGFGRNASSTTPITYTVDASSANVMKNNATSSVSSIAIGDMVMVEGSVSGTNVTAKVIRDGFPKMGMGMMGKGGDRGAWASSTAPIQGNGQPIVGGSVTAINGSTLTVTNKSNVTYTVDATNATVNKMGTSSATLASIAVGDNVIVQGTVNGTSVTASSITDQTGGASQGNNGKGRPGPIRGFFGAIGGFFQHLFGF